MDYRIFPPEEILETSVQLPPSKSIGARTLIMDFIGSGVAGLSETSTLGDCDDIATLRKILSQGIPADGRTVDVGDSGTALRMLTALYAASEGCRCRLTGSDSLRKRPVGPLVDALRALGAEISYAVGEGRAPLEITGRRLAGGTVELDASLSSQFATALMLTAPLMGAPLTIKYSTPAVSAPYVRLTAAMMSRRGVAAQADAEGITAGSGTYSRSAGNIEPDWSAAAFWYEIAAVSAGWVTLPGLRDDSLQGDRAAVGLFERLGATTEFSDEGAEISASPEVFSSLEADVENTPDMVPALVVACCLIGVPFRLSGVATLRHKESDRLEALCEEMARIGCPLSIENYDNVLSWDGRRMPVRELPVFDSHRDHRIAMALAAASVFLPGMVIRGADCASKSYPGFWADLAAAGFTLLDPAQPYNPDKEEQE